MTKQRWSIGPYGLVLLCIAGMTVNVFGSATPENSTEYNSTKSETNGTEGMNADELSDESSDELENDCSFCVAIVPIIEFCMKENVSVANITYCVQEHAIDNGSVIAVSEDILKFLPVIIPALKLVTQDPEKICTFTLQEDCSNDFSNFPSAGFNLVKYIKYSHSTLIRHVQSITEYVSTWI